MSGFSVRPAQLRAMAPAFGAEGDRLTQALTQLQERLDSLGAAWGEDKQGRAWGAQFVANRPVIEETLRVLGDGLRSGHQCLTVTADNYEACERANTIGGL